VGRQSGATDGFEAFIARAHAGLVRFGALLVGDAGKGEDLVQVALIKTYGAWNRLRDPAAAGAYTRKVMVREAGRWRRRRWVGEEPTAALPEPSAAGDATDRLVEHLRLLDALRSLPVGQRAVLLLRFLEGRSEAETAELLGISPGTVKSRTSRGLAALRDAGVHDDDDVLEPG
jgi:RNA polymerase sigma-70 factor (sigma-E family)